MWALENKSTGVCYRFIVGREYTVGRKDCDIIISDDTSISRKHAILKVLRSEIDLGNKNETTVLYIKDISKLGTQLPKERIKNGDERCLDDGDNIIFGVGNTNYFGVRHQPLVVTTSCLSKTLKKGLKKLIDKLGGHILNDWDDSCTFIIMANLSVTIKVACALLSQKRIVTVSYFEDCLKAIEGGMTNKLPSPDDYLPVMTESQIYHADVTFGPLPNRTCLFLQKTFVFMLKEQMNRLLQVIRLGGGNIYLLDVAQNQFTLGKKEKNLLISETTSVMLPDSNENSHKYEENIQIIIKYLNKLKRRMISESEIGFAVLYCNTDIYCCPKQTRQDGSQRMENSFLDILSEPQNMDSMYHHSDMNTVKSFPKRLKLLDDIKMDDISIKNGTELDSDSFENKSRSNLNKYSGPINDDNYTFTEDLFDNCLVRSENDHDLHQKTKITKKPIPSFSFDEKRSSKHIDNLPNMIEAPHAIHINNFITQNSQTDVEHHDELCKTSPKFIITTATNIIERNFPKNGSTNLLEPSESFLSTLVIDDKLIDAKFEAETEVQGGMVIQEKDLIHKHSENAICLNRTTTVNKDGCFLWKGERVINYKKFVKSGSLPSIGLNNNILTLPIIIGGQDLEPYFNNDFEVNERLAKVFKHYRVDYVPNT